VDLNVIYINTRKPKERNVEILRTLVKPGGFPKKNDFYRPNSWPKVTVTEITRTITTSYVKKFTGNYLQVGGNKPTNQN
jgi:hypothetical protein